MKNFTFPRLRLLFLFTSLLVLKGSAATLYWVGGAGEWHNTSHWSVVSGGNGGVKVPSAADDVIFDQNSFNSLNENLLLSGSMECHSITWTSDVNHPNISGSAGATLNIYGSLLLTQQMSWNYDGEINFKSQQKGNTINSSGKLLSGNITFDGSGSWQLNGALILSTSSTLTLSSGSVSTNGNAIQCGILKIDGTNYKMFDFSNSILSIKQEYTDAGSGNYHYNSAHSKIYIQSALPVNTFANIHHTAHNLNSRFTSSVINVDSVIIDPTCNGADTGQSCNGAIIIRKINATDGGPFSISWAGPKPGLDTVTADSVFNLCPNTYSYTIIDSADNTVYGPIFVTITAPPPFTVSYTKRQVKCNGLCDGWISTRISGETPNYTYRWSNGVSGIAIGDPSSPFIDTGLCAGTYSIRIKDTNGCVNTFKTKITQPLPVTIAFVPTNVTCNGSCNGAATATVSGGHGVYTYLWSPGGQTTSTISSLCAGIYTLTATDDSGCVGTGTVTITQPPALTIAISKSNVTCNGNCNGSATATVTGGTPAYTYKWNNGATTSSISSLCSGNYKVVVTDSHGCKDSANVTITQPLTITINVSQTNVTCNGNCDGKASVTITGGTPVYTYKWSTGATTSSISALCAGVYKIVVTDSNHCKDSANVTITQPTPLVITIAQTNPACNGNCNGTATATVSGGTPVYTYKWSTGATTSSISSLCAGAYKIVVTDKNGCKDSANVTITQPPGMIVTTTNTNVTCNGNCIGTATVSVSGGNAPYTYKWSTGATTTNVSSLCAGVYKIVVTDNKGCKDSANVTITQPNPLTIAISQTNVKCKGDCNGSATATVSGGTPAYIYKWSTGATTSSISSLCAGAYKIVVKDANGCKDSANVTITQPAISLTITTSQTNVKCNGDCNGTATATVTGGAPAYTYKWSTGATSSSVSALCAGVYKIVVIDNSGCKDSANVTITQPTPLAITTTQTNVTCNGNCIGTATATVTGGTPAYTYKWSTGATTSSVSNLCAGVYKLVVTDKNGCKDSVNVTITSPSPIVITISQTNITCTGNCNGTATATVSGGASPYTYKWSTGATTSSVSNLCAGVYKIVVTDKNGCKDSANVTITQPLNGLNITTTQTNVTCNGSCNGSATATVTGGTPAYTYKWSNGATTSSISSLCAGIYKIVVTDKNGCKDSANVTITQPSPIVITTSQTNVKCNGDCNGTASATVSGGTAPYTYKWNTGATTTSISGLCPGTSRIVITDANGCKDSADVIITQPTALIITTSQNNLTCNGNCNGTASVTVSGGTPAYTYKWSNGATTTSISSLCAGVYKIVVTDKNGCKDSANVTITQPTGIIISISNTNETCNGNCNGSVIATVSGGTPAYIYKWSNGATTSSISSLCAGVYKIVVTDKNGCKDSANVSITQPTALSIITAQTNATCNGNCNGTATATVTGGTPAYIYKWSNGATSSSISNLCAGVYKIVVTDANGCKDSANVTITQPAPIIITTSQTNVSCNGNCNGIANATVSGGAAPYTYKWSTGATTTSINNLCQGIYKVVVTDANGCKDSANVTITQPTPLIITTSQTNLTCNSNCNGTATATVSGGRPAYTYKWSTGATTSSVNSLCTGVYKIVVTDAKGCKDSANVTITQPIGITITTTNTNLKCNGDCNGTATATATGGQPAYTYKWSNGATTSSVSNLCAGIYKIVIVDANGCKDSANVIITQPTAIIISTSQTNEKCNGDCNGTASVNASGGTPGYFYKWSTGATTTSINNLCAGNYTGVVTDANGCKDSVIVSITQPNLLIAPISTLRDVSCNGFNNGVATVTPIGGTAPYTYLWTPPNNTTPSITGLSAGNYTISVTDANGCSVSESILISQPPVLTDSVSSTPASCSNFNGTATVYTNGGTTPYTYYWSPSAEVTATATGLSSGVYTVTVTDYNGCNVVDTITVKNTSTLNIVASGTDLLCNGANTGTATVSASGGTTPYTYLWNPGSGTTSTINNLSAGIYSIVVTDNNGCTQSATITITQPTAISLTVNSTGAGCSNNAGTASVSASGGTGAYTYSWNPGGGNTSIITGLGSGSYTVTVTDANGCSETAVANVANGGVSGSITSFNNISCFGDNNGSATVTVTSGKTPFTYSWSPSGQTTATATGLTAGSYTVTVTDSNGCSFTTSVSLIQPASALVETHVVSNASCNSTNDGSITLTVSGGTPQYAYTWSNGATTQNQSNILPGTYTVAIKDSNGCSITDTIIVPSNKTVIANAGRDTSLCANTTITLNGDSSKNAVTYKWLVMPSLNKISDSSFVTVSPSVTTTYILIVSNGGCSDTSWITITINPTIIADAGPTQYILPSQSVTIGGSPTGPGGSTYLWQPGFSLSDSTVSNPVASPSITTTYTVFVDNPNGCPGSDTVTVFVVPHVVIPDGFSPNGDGQNDAWHIGFINDFPGCEVEVYNRWGELLFRSMGYKAPWDGTYNGKQVPIGTYYYVINLHDPRFTQAYTGPVTILR